MTATVEQPSLGTLKDDEDSAATNNAAADDSDNVESPRPLTDNVIVCVGGMSFLLDPITIESLNSEYLNKKISDMSSQAASAARSDMKVKDSSDPESPSSQDTASTARSDDPDFGEKHEGNSKTVVRVDNANSECFSALIHMARFGGTLPTSIFKKEKKTQLLQQAEEVWGVQSQVEAALEKARIDFRDNCHCAQVVQRCLLRTSSAAPFAYTNPRLAPQQLVSNRGRQASSSSRARTSSTAVSPGVYLGGPHHNHRRDDGSRRVFCSSCGHRDIDWRYHIGDYYRSVYDTNSQFFVLAHYLRVHAHDTMTLFFLFSSCQKCNKEITYKPDLGWCHKCRQCKFI